MLFNFRDRAQSKAAQQQAWLHALYCTRVADALAQAVKCSHHATVSDLDMPTQRKVRLIAEHACTLLKEDQ